MILTREILKDLKDTKSFVLFDTMQGEVGVEDLVVMLERAADVIDILQAEIAYRKNHCEPVYDHAGKPTEMYRPSRDKIIKAMNFRIE